MIKGLVDIRYSSEWGGEESRDRWAGSAETLAVVVGFKSD